MSCHHRRWIQVACTLLVCCSVGGCGLSSGQGGRQTPHVGISLTAPMTGATIGVSRIRVTGTVTPANATVRVAGLPATVRGAAFARALALHQGTTTIPVTADASGWAPATVSVTVHYSHRLALALTAARAATWTGAKAPPPATGSPSDSGFVPVVSLGQPGAADGATGAKGKRKRGGSGSHGGSGTPPGTPGGSGTPAGTPGGSGTPAGTPGGSGTPTVPSGGSGTPTGTPSTGTPSPAPPGSGSGSGSVAAPAPLTSAQLEQIYLDGCRRAAGGEPAGRYCACMYDHISRARSFRSRARILALARRIERFNRTHNLTDLPKWLVHAQIVCVSRLPAPQLGLSRLPAVHHPAAAVPGS